MLLKADEQKRNQKQRIDVLDKALVNAHLIGVPGLGTLTVGGLPGGVLEDTGRETDRALDPEALVLGPAEEVRADLLEGLDVAGSQGDPDLLVRLFSSVTKKTVSYA